LFADERAKLTIAHTRLAVIDLVTGSQPLQSEDGNLVLAANGEIYDFERIRASLEAKGHRFSTHSDSEVILYLYKEYGLDCFEHLRGEFAFLLYDKAKRRLIAARDRFGIKPLYFSRLDSGFVFASEMKAIFASRLVAPKLNALAFDPLAARDSADVQFPFEGIEQVPPASYLAINVDSGESCMAAYWSAEIPSATADPIEASAADRAGAAESVLRELEEAVRLRLRSDVPVGLYLSGGIDSAFVGALMKRNLRSGLHSFSISFEGSRRNEGALARRAAELLGTQHHDLRVTKQMLWDNLEDCLWHSELPFVTLAPVGKFLLSREAKQRVTVVLTGEGADEVFLGYRSFFQKAICDTRAGEPNRKTTSLQLRRLKQGPLTNRVLHKFSLLLFDRRRRDQLKGARTQGLARSGSAKPLINAVQESRIAGMPLDILCYLGDREEMAHSLEARLPFLDHELYDAAKRIPVDLKVRDGLEKAVLRDAAKGVLPDDFRLRRKTGFMATSETVDFGGADRDAAKALGVYLSREAFAAAGVFSYRAYRAVRLVAKLPATTRRLKGLRRNANKVIMYMMQVHMLHDMFIARTRWAEPQPRPTEPSELREPIFALSA
jgi:asparagine synthase (glutamine-hydrolysing)